MRRELEQALAANGDDPIERLEQMIATAKSKGEGTVIMEGLKKLLERPQKKTPRKKRSRAKSD